MRVLFIHILAVEDGDELRFAGRCLVGEPVEQRGDVAVGAEQLAVQKCQIIALVDVEAVKIGIARGVGDLRGGYALRGVRHRLGDGVGVAHVGIDGHHRAHALRDGGGWDDHDGLLRQADALLCGHDDVLVVRQHENGVRGDLFDLLEDALGRGIHGLSAADDAVGAKVGEDVRKALTRADREEAKVLFGLGFTGIFVLGGFELLLDGLKVVGGLGLAAGGELLGLRAHVLDLRKLERAVLLRFGQRLARNVGVNVDFESLVVLADDERIADAVEEAAERLNAASALADDEHGVEREGDVLFVEHGKIGLLLCILFGELGALLAAQGAEHTAENQQESLAARVDDAGLFENGVHVSRLRERDLALGDGLLDDVLDAVVLLGRVHGALGSETRNGQDRALGGLHHGVVRRGNALLKRCGERRAVGLLAALELLGDAAEEKRQNDAGVAARAAQQRRRRDRGGLIDRRGLDLLELLRRGLDGKTHVRARVAVGNGEYIQIIDSLLCLCDGDGAEEQHLLEHGTIDGIVHRMMSSSVFTYSCCRRKRRCCGCLRRCFR